MSSILAQAPAASVLEDMMHLGPMVVVGAWSLLLLLVDAFARPGMRTTQRRLALAGLAAAGVWGLTLFGSADYDGGVPVFYGFLKVDQFSLFLDLALLAVTAGVLAFAGTYARSHRFEYGEQESLVFIALFGMMTLVHSNDLIALFLGIETMSISVYVLVGARWNSRESAEGAIKYFLMGAFASALLLMGIALIYGALGSIQFSDLRLGSARAFTPWGSVHGAAQALEQGLRIHPSDMDLVVQGIAPAALFMPGLLLVLAALLFKVAAVPLHMWTPDAYDGAPTPITAFMGSAVKVASVAALLKVFVGCFSVHRLATVPYGWTSVVAFVALLSMIVGNFAAVRQTNIKRLFAYSSIAHVGYILVGVVAAANFYGDLAATSGLRPVERLEWSRVAGDTAVSGVLYYLVTYAIASLGAFAAVAWLSANKREALRTHEWAGLAREYPGMALGLTVCVISLMGLPPTAGFFGKLFVFRAAFENSNEWLRILVVIALVNSVVGAYYYLRLIVSMYFRDPPPQPREVLPGAAAPTVVALAATAVVACGVLAGPVLQRTDLAASGFSLDGQGKADWVDGLRATWESSEMPGDEVEEEAAADDAAVEGDAPLDEGAAQQPARAAG